MMRPFTHAMVLAAGLGTRMQHLTADKPKPLIEVAGRTLLDRVLDQIEAAGIERAVVNVHYLADQIERHLASRRSPSITISDERDARLETGGGVKRALPLLGGQPFIIQNADCFWIEGIGQNLQRLIAAWDEDRMDALLLLTGAADTSGYEGRGDFQMDAVGQLQRRKPNTDAPFVFAGASIASPRLFRETPDGAFSLNRIWDRAIDDGRLFGVRMDGIWMHVGTPDAIDEAERRLQDHAT
ncbi:MAG: nucleotidyltransferase family protein [Pseudomonadota bacterium]